MIPPGTYQDYGEDLYGNGNQFESGYCTGDVRMALSDATQENCIPIPAGLSVSQRSLKTWAGKQRGKKKGGKSKELYLSRIGIGK